MDIRPLGVYGVQDVNGAHFGLRITTPTQDKGGFVQGKSQHATSYGIYTFNTRTAPASTRIERISVRMNGPHGVGILARGRNLTIHQTHVSSDALVSLWRMEWRPLIFIQNGFNDLLVSDNLVEGGYHMGIGIFSSPDRIGDGQVMITRNTVRHRQVYTDGYAIVAKGIKNAAIAGNIIEPQAPFYGRGISLDTMAGDSNGDSDMYDVSVSGNVLRYIQERPNAEFGANTLESPGIRIRCGSIPIFRNVRVSGNVINVHSGFGLSLRTHGVFVSSNNPENDPAIEGNTIVASTDMAEAHADTISFQDVHSESITLVQNNFLMSNSTILGFSDIDTTYPNAGILVRENTFVRGDNPRPDFHAIRYGYSNLVNSSNSFFGNSCIDCSVHDFCWNTTSQSNLVMGWRMRATVLRDDVPVEGVVVTVRDILNNELAMPTDTAGTVTFYLPEYRLSGAGQECPDLTTLTRVNYTPYTVSIEGSEPQLFTGWADGDLTFHLY